MSRIMEEMAADAVRKDHTRLIRNNRAKGHDDEFIASFLGESLEYVRKLAPPTTQKN